MDFAPPVCKNMVYRYWAQLPSNGYEQSFAFAQLKGNSDKSPNWAPIIPSTKKYEVQLITGQKTSNLFTQKHSGSTHCCVHQPDWLRRRLLQSYMVSRYYSFYYIDLCISIFFWTLFKNVHCRGPCSLRPCISRPYCISQSIKSSICNKNDAKETKYVPYTL